MYIQIRLEFKELCGESLLGAIQRSGVSGELVSQLQNQLFGTDVVGVAENLHKLLRNKLTPERALRVSKEWEHYPSRYREGVIELYNDRYPTTPITKELSLSPDR